MLWFPLALFAALISGGRRVYDKHLTHRMSNFSVGFAVQAFSLLPTLVLFLFLPIPQDLLHLPWTFWWPLLIIWFVLYPVQTHFMYHAIREGELSRVLPVVALLPALNAISSWLIIGEVPTTLGVLGIFLSALAVYLLLIDQGKESANKVWHRNSVPSMLIATVCIAIGSTLDKVSIGASTPVFYSFINTLGASIIFLILIRWYGQREEFAEMKSAFWPLTLIGIFQALNYTATMLAYSLGPTSYVLAVRSGNFLFTSLYGIFFLKETLSRKKLSALALFTGGLLFVAFG